MDCRDGEKIRIFEDVWLRGKENYRVESRRSEQDACVKFCDLFIPGERRWDVQKVSNLFQSCDAKAILATPIPRSQVCDRISWSLAVDGKYSVKSGYKFWHSNFSTCRRVNHEKGWRGLWGLDVPQKVKIFMWRICRNNVPVHVLLRGRGVQTPIICPMCETNVEHLRHIYISGMQFCKRVLEVNGPFF